MPQQVDDYRARKAERTARFAATYGVKLETCSACSGSGRYDHNGSPPCGCCNGSGKVRGKLNAGAAEGNEFASCTDEQLLARLAAAKSALGQGRRRDREVFARLLAVKVERGIVAGRR